MMDMSFDGFTAGLILVNILAIILVSIFAIKNSFLNIKNLGTDKETGFLNIKNLKKQLNKRIVKSGKNKEPLSLMLVDLDNFGHYNKSHGLIRGNDTLREISRIVKDNVKSADVIGREGSKFFVVSGSEHENALKNAEILRRKIQDYEFYGQESLHNKNLTASIGLITSYGKHNCAEMLKNADHTLKFAKNNGKNSVWGVDLKKI